MGALTYRLGMSIQERGQKILQGFSGLSTWEEKYRRIIELGKSLAPLASEFHTDDLRVKGCQSQVWLHASQNDLGQVIFAGDCDALIVKGLVAMLIEFYSGSSPDEILQTPPQFIEELGLSGNLSPSRANGLFAMVKQIRYYAAAFKALQGLKRT